jgi:sialic acid synthase SpsE
LDSIYFAFELQEKIKFLCTAFDCEYLDFLLKLNIQLIKIPSGEINNIFLLNKAAKSNKPILLSTGASTLDDIIFALDAYYGAAIEYIFSNNSTLQSSI